MTHLRPIASLQIFVPENNRARQFIKIHEIITVYWLSESCYRFTKMELSEFSRKYLFIFYVIGQSAFNPKQCTKIRTRKQIVVQNIPIIVIGHIVILTTLSGITFQNIDTEEFSPINIFFGNTFLLLMCTTNMIAFVQNIRYQNNLKNIINKFAVIEQIFTGRLCIPLSLSKFFRHFRGKVLVCLSLYSMAFAIMLAINTYQERTMKVTLHIFLLMFLGIVASLHALLYIEMEHFFISFFVDNIELAVKTRHAHVLFYEDKSTSAVIMQLGYYKHVHFKLWDISQTIGRHFGWILILICMQSFVDATYTAYWIYRFIWVEFDIMILRKYIFNVHKFSLTCHSKTIEVKYSGFSIRFGPFPVLFILVVPLKEFYCISLYIIMS